jgi:aldose 1-epimerase
MNSRVSKVTYGTLPDGTAVECFTLTNRHGLSAGLMTRGATLVSLQAPDRGGRLADVTLGFDSLEEWLNPANPYMGCIVGRYANRIARGSFTLDGKEHRLAINNGPNALHGGLHGFDKVVWSAQVLNGEIPAVKFSHTSPDGEEGYPGTLRAEVTYSLSDTNELRLDYLATTDQPTVINLTNHAYWNLAGEGTVTDHVLTLQAGQFTEVNTESIPTGMLRDVAGTPMDFRTPAPLGARIDQIGNQPAGYDHNFVIQGGGGSQPVLAARVEHPSSGRVLEILTTHPGVQLYTGNYLDGTLVGKGGERYARHAGFCLETQHYPDSPNQPAFPTTVLRPGQTYRQITIHRFSTLP